MRELAQMTFTRHVRVAEADGAKSNIELFACPGDSRLVLTSVRVMADSVNTEDVGVQVGFGTAAVPTPALTANDGIAFDHPGVSKGGGAVVNNHGEPIAYGAADEDLRYTCEEATGGSISIIVTGYIDAYT